MQNQLLENLTFHLKMIAPRHEISSVYEYAVLPPGKLFRPQMVIALFNDLNKELDNSPLENPFSDHSLLASFVEMHHAYTLVHDDLPCMDDDDLRRGKPSVHKAFGEWKAVLIGDGLLNASYQLLAKIKSPNFALNLGFITWALGPKGLIHGQVLDLSEEMTESFEKLLLTHQNKTARLIQVCLVSSYLLLESKPDFKISKNLFRLGHNIGIIFQLLDDLTELNEENLSTHEQSVNPWLTTNALCFEEVLKQMESMESLIDAYELRNIRDVLGNYFKKIFSILNDSKETIEAHAKKANTDFELAPMMSLLKRIGQF